MSKINLFWFRRDLRLEDNAGLYHALRAGRTVLPVFLFDRNILDDLEDKKDARVEFIHHAVAALHGQLKGLGSTLLVYSGHPEQLWKELSEKYDIEAVFTNRDYEPYALKRDKKIAELLKGRGIAFHTFKDHVIFEKGEVLKDDGNPYTVFTPYSRKWRDKLDSAAPVDNGFSGNAGNDSFYLQSYPTAQYSEHFHKTAPAPLVSLEDLGFERTGMSFPSTSVSRGLIKNYDQTRDIPGIEGTSRLGIHFRFGTISIREKARKARELNATYLNELIWRDFYSMILAHFPHVATRAFKPEYDRIQWLNNEDTFERWKEGRTGYPIVDAGMRELSATGYMHNRVRMVTASFLTKHLLIDWRWGEAWFARKLLDFDLASNNGGWQWAAGSGTDAAPYFRIFNPTAQQEKFDKDFRYIRRWVPEYGTDRYPQPIVDHKMARERCLETYKRGLA